MKKILKAVGNLIVVIALVFLIKKFSGMNIDFNQIKSGKVIFSLVISIIIQTLLIIFGCFPWLVFTQSLSGKKIPFSSAMPVYTRSNIYKYLPGNVFQYVGRNKLASDMNISHIDVACATVFDILFCVVSTGIISVILLGGAISDLIRKYGKNFLIVGISGIVLLIVLFLIFYIKFRSKLKEYILRYSKAFERGNRLQLLQGILYYLLNGILSALMYFISLSLIFGKDSGTSEIISFTGAFMFAWIIGFVTPGAPGGIGIRESVMLFVCGSIFEEKIMLFVLVMRLSSIIADFIAFIIGNIYKKVQKTADC